MRIQSFINSKFVGSSQRTIKKNPFTLESLHEIEACDLMQTVQAIQGAQKAFVDWKMTSISQRTVLIEKIIRVLQEKKTEFAKAEALDQGLPLNFSLSHNVEAAIYSFVSAKAQLENYKVEQELQHSATGTISMLSSWNCSLRVICERLAPAIAAGNAVIVKISSQSPITAVILAEVLAAAEVPQGLIQILVSDDQDVKNLLVTHPGIKAICFTGQLKNAAEILKKVSAQSFNQFKKVQIATGSKNTAVSLNDPHESQFNEIMESFLIGQGQLSWNSNRLFVLEKYESEWQQKIEAYFSSLRPATSINDTSNWGPCIKAESFTHFSEIESMAVSDQAKLIQPSYVLSDSEKNCFLKPTFTKDMSNCSTLQQDQVMAPLFILSVVKYPFDIAKYSNVSYYGQSAHIWGAEDKIEKIAEQLEVAHVFRNRWSVKHHEPNHGVKQSAFGILDYRVFGDFFSNAKKLT